MKKVFFFIFIVLNQLQGQNLISNYSFENHGQCPHNISCPYIKIPGQNLNPDIVSGRYFDWYFSSNSSYSFASTGNSLSIIFPNFHYSPLLNFIYDSILTNQNPIAFKGDHYLCYIITKFRSFSGVNWDYILFVPIISTPLDKTTEIDDYCGYFYVRNDSRNSFLINNIDIALSKDSIVNLANPPSFSFSNTDIVNNSLVVSINDSSINKSDKWRKVLFNVSVNDHYNHFSLGVFDPNLSPSSFNVIDSSTSLSRRRFNNNPQAMFQSFYSLIFFDDFHFFKCSDTLFTVQLPADTTLCEGESLLLTAQVIDSTYMLENETRHYQWSTGDTTPSITVNQAGTYWVKVGIDGQYSAYDTIVVNYIYNFSPQIAPYPDTLCLGQSAWLGVQVPQEVSILWSNGDSSATTQIYEAGVYYVHTYNECFSYTDTLVVFEKDCTQPPIVEYPIYIPNAFTPNGDGVNDVFEIFGLPEGSEVLIFNKWGQVVFLSTDVQLHWDGTYRGEAVPQGVYPYIIRIKNEGEGTSIKRGEVRLYR